MTGEQALDTIRVEMDSRWDALDLARRLVGLHTYLVQLGNSRWVVCIRAEDGTDALPHVRRTAEEWAYERNVDSVVRAGGCEYALPRA